MNYDKTNVSQYDADREIPNIIKNDIVEYLLKSFPKTEFPLLAEPGVGTGRWAIPLAKAGYEVTGFDISIAMMDQLRKKLKEEKDIKLKLEIGDVTSSHFDNSSFNICFVSHLFHLIPDLNLAINEINRIVNRESGIIVHLKGGKGNSIPELTAMYINELKLAGSIINSFSDKVETAFELIKDKGFKQTNIEKDTWKWKKSTKIEEAIALLNGKSFSFTNIATDDVHKSIIKTIEEFCLIKYKSLQTEIEVPNIIRMSIFKR